MTKGITHEWIEMTEDLWSPQYGELLKGKRYFVASRFADQMVGSDKADRSTNPESPRAPKRASAGTGED